MQNTISSTKDTAALHWCVLLALLFFTLPSRAAAINLGDVRKKLSETLDLKAQLQSTAKAITGGAAEGLREQAELLIDNKIDPLLNRVDTIVSSKIEQAAAEAMRLLRTADTMMHGVIDHLDAVIAKRSTEINKMAEDRIRQASDAVTSMLIKVDDILGRELCKVAPHGNGLRIRGIPFVDEPDEILIAEPLRTHCYRTMPASQANPSSARFVGHEYYAGEMCELELQLSEIDPFDSDSIERTARIFEKLAAMAAQSLCLQPTNMAREEMLTAELRYEERADFFRTLYRGGSRLVASTR